MHKVTNELRIVKIQKETANVYRSKIRSQERKGACLLSSALTKCFENRVQENGGKSGHDVSWYFTDEPSFSDFRGSKVGRKLSSSPLPLVLQFRFSHNLSLTVASARELFPRQKLTGCPFDPLLAAFCWHFPCEKRQPSLPARVERNSMFFCIRVTKRADEESGKLANCDSLWN